MHEKTTQTWKIGNCLDLLPEIPDKSIDMILTDLPYGTTQCKWDTIIPFEPLWKQYERIITDNGVIVLTSTQPFTSFLIMSNIEMFRYEWIWNKKRGSNFLTATQTPLKIHENICVFSNRTPNYNPIKTPKSKETLKRQERGWNCEITKSEHHNVSGKIKTQTNTNFPVSIITFNKETNNQFKKITTHSTQKPVALFEYFIKTYTNEGDTVHDSCLGSGTTLEACMNLNRNCIGFEIDPQWELIYRKRLHLDTNKIEASIKTIKPVHSLIEI